jgi:hypothetical protein
MPRDSASKPDPRLHPGFLDRPPRIVAHWIPAFAGMTKRLLKLTLMTPYPLPVRTARGTP